MLYAAFGTDIASDLPLESLPVSKALMPAVTFQHRSVSSLGSVSANAFGYDSQRRRIYSTLRDNGVRLRVDDDLHFSLLLQQRRIVCLYTQRATQEQVHYWLLQKALPAYLLLQGEVELLHGSAVEIGGRVAAFTAPSGTGKSTLVHHLVAEGHALFADEHVVIPNGTNMALPTIPYLRPKRQAESLGEVASTFASGPLPLGCIYLLTPAASTAPVSMEVLSGAAAVAALSMRQQFDLRGLKGSRSSQRLEHFRYIAGRVKVKRLHVPRDLKRLPEVMMAVHHDILHQEPVPC